MSKTRFLVLIEMSVKERQWHFDAILELREQELRPPSWKAHETSSTALILQPQEGLAINILLLFTISLYICSLFWMWLSYWVIFYFMIILLHVSKTRLILKTIFSQFGEMVQSVRCSLCDDEDLNSICLNLYKIAKEMVLACNPSTSTLTQEDPWSLLAIHSSQSVNSRFME